MKTKVLFCALFLPVLLAAQTQINGSRDLRSIPAPGNPPAGHMRIYADVSTGKLECKDYTGSSCSAVGTSHGQNTDTGTSQACFQLANASAGPKLCTDGAGGFSLKTATDVVVMACTVAGVCSYSGVGGGELELFGSTSGSVIQKVPAAAGTSIVTWPAASGQVALRYAASFTSQTILAVLGSAHNLGTCDVGVVVWDTSVPAQTIEPDRVTCNATTFDIVITFGAAQSGRYVIR